MIEFYVSGQNLRVYTPVIAADTLNGGGRGDGGL